MQYTPQFLTILFIFLYQLFRPASSILSIERPLSNVTFYLDEDDIKWYLPYSYVTTDPEMTITATGPMNTSLPDFIRFKVDEDEDIEIYFIIEPHDDMPNLTLIEVNATDDTTAMSQTFSIITRSGSTRPTTIDDEHEINGAHGSNNKQFTGAVMAEMENENIFVAFLETDDEGDSDIVGRIFNSNSGDQIGAQFTIAGTEYPEVSPQLVPLKNGNVMVIYTGPNIDPEEDEEDNENTDIYGIIFTSTGEVSREAFLVNTELEEDQYNPVAVRTINGSIFVAWENIDSLGGSHDIYGFILNETGDPVLEEPFMINQVTVGSQFSPALFIVESHYVMVTWYSGIDTNPVNTRIFARLYLFDGTIAGTPLQMDGAASNQLNTVFYQEGHYVTMIFQNPNGIYASLFTIEDDQLTFDRKVQLNDQTAAVYQAQSVLELPGGETIFCWTDGTLGLLCKFFENTQSVYRGESKTENDKGYALTLTELSSGNALASWYYGDVDNDFDSGLYGVVLSGNGSVIVSEFQISKDRKRQIVSYQIMRVSTNNIFYIIEQEDVSSGFRTLRAGITQVENFTEDASETLMDPSLTNHTSPLIDKDDGTVINSEGEDNGLSGGIIASIVIAGLLFIGLMAYFYVSAVKATEHSSIPGQSKAKKQKPKAGAKSRNFNQVLPFNEPTNYAKPPGYAGTNTGGPNNTSQAYLNETQGAGYMN